MNIETEMEWNSHMIKSGLVFGTYDFMISKGHSWNDINYVVWDIDDDTGMPLVKAVASALNTHPDILLKEVQQVPLPNTATMAQNIQQQQQDAMNQRMEGQRGLTYNPKPTGAELWQAGKPAQAAVATWKDFVSRGDYSRGGNVDAMAGTGEEMKERYRLRDRLNPKTTLDAMGGKFKDSMTRNTAGNRIKHNTKLLNRKYAGKDEADMSPKDLANYKQAQEMVQEGTDDMNNPALNRTVQERKKDALNQKWLDDGGKKNGPAPYPKRQELVERQQEQRGGVHLRGREVEQPTDKDAAEAEALAEDIDPAAQVDRGPVETLPEETLNAGPPVKVGPREWEKIVPNPPGKSRKNWIGAIAALEDKAKAENRNVNRAELEVALKGKRKATKGTESKEDIMDALMNYFDELPREVAASIAENVVAGDNTEKFAHADPVDEDAAAAKKKATAKKKPAAAKKKPAAAKKKPAEKEWTNEDEGFGHADDDEDDEFGPADDDKKNRDFSDPDPDDEDEDEKKNPKNPKNPTMLQSEDDAMNYAWNHLTILKGRQVKPNAGLGS